MKLNRILSTLATASLLWSQSYAKESLTETYHEPKHIMFMSTFGGSSHVSWVLTILDELSKRGHKITYVTRVRIILLFQKASHLFYFFY